MTPTLAGTGERQRGNDKAKGQNDASQHGQHPKSDTGPKMKGKRRGIKPAGVQNSAFIAASSATRLVERI
jgi:hypothetical protein